MSETTAPARVLGMRAATALGIASMLGAGVFAVWAPASAAAGDWLPAALALAALIAGLNALSTMRLAVAHPVAGGAWAYARAEVAPTVGFAAGVLFLVGKTASAAAIASLIGTAISPAHARPIALAVIAVAATITALGVRSTARVAGTVAAIVVATILAVVIAAWAAPSGSGAAPPSLADAITPGPSGVLSAAALLFFAFAGYARIATLAEEVRAPERTLPRAALVSIGVVFALYAALAVTLLSTTGAAGVAASDNPVVDLVGPGWQVGVRVVAVLAAVGSLLGVLAGLGRTAAAMASAGDVPRVFAHRAARGGSPVRADAVLALAALAAVAFVDTPALIAASSASVLGYYALAHLASFRRPGALRWRVIAVLGALGCGAVAVSTPPAGTIVLAGIVVIALAVRGAVRLRRSRPRPGRR